MCEGNYKQRRTERSGYKRGQSHIRKLLVDVVV